MSNLDEYCKFYDSDLSNIEAYNEEMRDCFECQCETCSALMEL